MNVFISFSGPLSKAFAELLREWLPEVIQRVTPWISSEDIAKGKLWATELNEALAIKVGISCVTQENKKEPWLLYEAGALRKGLPEARVCTLLIDLQPQDLQSPLGDFQATRLDKEDVWR